VVSVVGSGGAPTVAEAREAERLAAFGDVQSLPLVRAALSVFPDAKVVEVRSLLPPPEEAAAALPEDWDPFEDD
jgi:DNA polymerase-3 subunit gamma/tau